MKNDKRLDDGCYWAMISIVILSFCLLLPSVAVGQDTNGLPDIWLPVPKGDKGDTDKDNESEKDKTEIACNPQVYITIHAFPSQGMFTVSLKWGGNCSGPEYVTFGIQVKSLIGWQDLLDPHTKWELPEGGTATFELNPIYTTIMVTASVECACGNLGEGTETGSYGGTPLGYIYWLMKQFYKM